MIAINRPSFRPGKIVATQAAFQALRDAGQSAWEFLSRHVKCDWGIVDADDKLANDDALKDGSRLLSAYLLNDVQKTKIWIITEAEDGKGVREATTILLPEEY